MSTYKKALRNEHTLPEIDGVKPILRPTRDEVFKVIEIFKIQSVKKDMPLVEIRALLTDLLYNSLFIWVDNKRSSTKDPENAEITRDDIDDYVVRNIFNIWMEVLFALDIINKEKFNELQKESEAKKKELESDPK